MTFAIGFTVLAAAADTGAAPRPDLTVCGADSLYTRVPVYVHVTVATRADTVAAPSLALIAQSVATRVRAELGAAVDSVPRLDSLVAAAGSAARRDTTIPKWWARIDSAGIRVVARRDGSLRWTPLRAPASPIADLLDRGLTDAQRAGETFIPAEVFTADSLVFTLDYAQPFDVVGGRVRPRAYGAATLVAFTLKTAVEKQAATVPGTFEPRYPKAAREEGANAFVRMSFVVDTTGRAIPSTIHDVWPNDRPRNAGRLGAFYEQFAVAATTAVVRARFSAAEIAGCKVRQWVEMPMTFTLTR